MEKFCKSLIEHANEIISFKNKKHEAINKRAAEICYVCEEKLKKSMLKNKNIAKLEITVIIQGNIEALHIVYVI